MSDAAAVMTAEEPRPASAVTSPPRVGLLDRTDLAALAALFVLFAATRGAVFPYAQNLYGDAVVRSEIAQRWADHPHLIRSFKDDTYQFGPLHFYYMGAVLELWPSREHATRFSSLLAGLLFLVPLYRLGKRLFGRRAAILSSALVGLWTLHIQASTTAASEALMLTLVFFALDHLFRGMEEQTFAPLAWAALYLNLACATRYDGWMFIPLFALAIALSGKDRIASCTRAVMFTPLALLFPLWWMQGNEKATGDALYAIHYIDNFHANWVKDGIAWLGETKFRLHNLVFWPACLLTTCSLLAGIFSFAGMVRGFREGGSKRALVLLIAVPTAYFTFRGAVLMNFSPLSRFTMLQLAMALLFFEDGFSWLLGKRTEIERWSWLAATFALAIATPLWLGHFTAWKTGIYQESLRPLGPLSTVPLDQDAAARFIREHVGPGEGVIIDEDPHYIDITVTFFTGLPETRLARKRWDTFDRQLGLMPTIPWMLATVGGALEKEGVKAGEETVTFRGRAFRMAAPIAKNIFVYRAAD